MPAYAGTYRTLRLRRNDAMVSYAMASLLRFNSINLSVVSGSDSRLETATAVRPDTCVFAAIATPQAIAGLPWVTSAPYGDSC